MPVDFCCYSAPW